MTAPLAPADSPVVRRLQSDAPLVSVELRPPRSDLSHQDSIDTWIDMHHGVRRLARKDTLVFLTDNAVGQAEEENLHHLETNLEGREIDQSKLVPFLTCKHSLEYCQMYAARAASYGYQALTVLGGDKDVGRPRCVDHACDLRRQIRKRVPQLALGGWANPHRDVTRQVDYLLDEDFAGEFYLTQVVSHHDLPAVERFVEETRRRGVTQPGVFGVFFYRSSRTKTLKRLSQFLPVPIEGLKKDFEAGLSPVDICARTVNALREVGADKVYVSNFPPSRARARLDSITGLL
jgi:5,10-methylenetetrahydrofolate reductase